MLRRAVTRKCRTSVYYHPNRSHKRLFDFEHMSKLPDIFYDGFVAGYGYTTFMLKTFLAALNTPSRFYLSIEHFLSSVESALPRLTQNDLSFLFENLVPSADPYSENTFKYCVDFPGLELEALSRLIMTRNLFLKIECDTVQNVTDKRHDSPMHIADVCEKRIISVLFWLSENNGLAIAEGYNADDSVEHPVPLARFAKIATMLFSTTHDNLRDEWNIVVFLRLVEIIHVSLEEFCGFEEKLEETRVAVQDIFAKIVPLEKLGLQVLKRSNVDFYRLEAEPSRLEKPKLICAMLLSNLQFYASQHFFDGRQSSKIVHPSVALPPPNWTVGIDGGAEYKVHDFVMLQWKYFLRAASAGVEESRTKRLILPSEYSKSTLLLILAILYGLDVSSTLQTGNIVTKMSDKDMVFFVQNAEEYDLVTETGKDPCPEHSRHCSCAHIRFASAVAYVRQMLSYRDKTQFLLYSAGPTPTHTPDGVHPFASELQNIVLQCFTNDDSSDDGGSGSEDD